MFKTSILLMLCVFFSKIFGFFREIVISYYYGTTLTTDAFFVAQNIPTIIFAAIGAAISVAVIPIYTEMLNKNKKEASQFINNLLTISFLITSLLMVLCIVFSDNIVYVFASSLSNEGLVLASRMLKILSVTLYFTMFSYICGGMLNSNNKFYIPQLAAIPYNIISILSVMIFFNKMDIWALVIGTILGMFVQTLMYLIPLRKINTYKFTLKLKDKRLKQLLLLSWPMVIVVLSQELNVIVDKNIASGIAVGAISAINYSNRVIGIIYGIFSVSIMTILYSKFNELIIKKQKEEVFKTLLNGLIIVLMVTLPVTMLSLIFNKEIISILFGRGAFDINAINMTSSVYLYYAFSIFSMAANDIILRCYYSNNDSKNPMIITIISVILNVILSLILSKSFGLNGIALATSIASNIQMITLIVVLKLKYKFIMKSFVFNMLKLVVVNIIFLGILYITNNIIIINNLIIKLLVIGIINLIVYVFLIYIFNFKLFNDFISQMLKRVKKRFNK